MESSVIRQRLDLLIRLIDTTTGAPVEERNIRFFRALEPVRPVARGGGNHVFLNCGREDFELEVRVYGYDPVQTVIRYETLEEKLPIQEIFLIPSENASVGQPVLSLSGHLPGIQSIQAVNMSATCCCISDFDERRRIMKLFRMHRSGMDGIYYGLIHPDRQTFEPFTVVKELAKDSVKIARPLEEPFMVNAPVSRIIFGSVTSRGDYCIRVRDDGRQLRHLIRYVVDDEVRFRTVDFHNPEQEFL